MELTRLAPIFKCPACGRVGATLDGDRALVCDCGKSYGLCGKSVQTVASIPMSAAWKQKQAEGEERYRDKGYHANETVDRLFGGFIAVNAKRDDVLLDVGCGIRETPPPYVSELALENYLGLEPLAEATPRTYACLAGALVEKIPLADASVNGVIFCTSLDHIEHIGPAYEEVHRVLAPGGRLYIWVDFYEPEILAKTQSYHHLFYRGSLVKRAARLLFPRLVLARFLGMLVMRRYRLARGLPLDEKHFRHYTREKLFAEMERYGLEIDRLLVMPGTNAAFVEARFTR